MKKEVRYPSFEIVQEHISKFDNNKEFVVVEKALLEVFEKYPGNQNLHHILIKATVLNSLYNTNIFAIVKMARHSLNGNIDARLQNGLPELVEEIARAPIGRKGRRNYSFATKYCHWHQPDKYPIYDSYVERLLWTYRKQDAFMKFKRTDLQQYTLFKEIVEGFRESYKLTQFNFKELDKFLWSYGKEIFGNNT